MLAQHTNQHPMASSAELSGPEGPPARGFGVGASSPCCRQQLLCGSSKSAVGDQGVACSTAAASRCVCGRLPFGLPPGGTTCCQQGAACPDLRKAGVTHEVSLKSLMRAERGARWRLVVGSQFRERACLPLYVRQWQGCAVQGLWYSCLLRQVALLALSRGPMPLTRAMGLFP
jgi:hypothetical protein